MNNYINSSSTYLFVRIARKSTIYERTLVLFLSTSVLKSAGSTMSFVLTFDVWVVEDIANGGLDLLQSRCEKLAHGVRI